MHLVSPHRPKLKYYTSQQPRGRRGENRVQRIHVLAVGLEGVVKRRLANGRELPRREGTSGANRSERPANAAAGGGSKVGAWSSARTASVAAAAAGATAAPTKPPATPLPPTV